MRDKMTFDEFVAWIKYGSSTCIHPVLRVNQLAWLVDTHDNLLADFIGKFEYLQKDWATISTGLALTQELPHWHKIRSEPNTIRNTIRKQPGRQ